MKAVAMTHLCQRRVSLVRHHAGPPWPQCQEGVHKISRCVSVVRHRKKQSGATNSLWAVSFDRSISCCTFSLRHSDHNMAAASAIIRMPEVASGLTGTPAPTSRQGHRASGPGTSSVGDVKREKQKAGTNRRALAKKRGLGRPATDSHFGDCAVGGHGHFAGGSGRRPQIQKLELLTHHKGMSILACTPTECTYNKYNDNNDEVVSRIWLLIEPLSRPHPPPLH